jgi:cell wall-associated NlpC family hydrolase
VTLANFKIFGFAIAMVFAGVQGVFAQDRPRVVTTGSSRPTGVTSTSPGAVRPVLSSPIVVQTETRDQAPLVAKTASSRSAAAFKSNYGSLVSSMLIRGIQSRWGTPYRLGSTGPDRYDCSGFVWSVFTDAGFAFPRSSAKTYWDEFEPVEGAERFKFGTLVFFNKLGHVGIVADENGFYHASSSKGITYSPFAGYWEKRIVGFRRVPAEIAPVQSFDLP